MRMFFYPPIIHLVVVRLLLLFALSWRYFLVKLIKFHQVNILTLTAGMSHFWLTVKFWHSICCVLRSLSLFSVYYEYTHKQQQKKTFSNNNIMMASSSHSSREWIHVMYIRVFYTFCAVNLVYATNRCKWDR